jgi:Domain of Unknown Function (DUF1080).
MKTLLSEAVKYAVLLFLATGFLGCGDKAKTDAVVEANPNAGFNSLFFDIHDTSIKIANSDSVPRFDKRFESLNLSGKDALWQGHDNFFMHALGAINFSDTAKYKLRLAVNGKMMFRLNNIEIFKNSTPKDTVAESSVNNNQGENIFEIEYFDGGVEPKIILEWSKDGGPFEIVPKEAYTIINRTQPSRQASAAVDSTTNLNALTAQEKKDGWKLLFDGKSTKGWHRYNSPGTIGGKWVAENGNLTFIGRHRFRYTLEGYVIEMGPTDKRADGGLDIVTDNAYNDFELNLEWKVSEGGNSGIFYTVLEDPKYDEAWKTSPEMQVLDNYGNKDGIIYKHKAGDLYDLIACKEIVVNPAGEWNRVRVVKNKGAVQHWLNDVLVVEYSLTSPEWKEMISKSKFSSLQDYATAKQCRIGLQDHDNEVWYRNIKIKELK